MFCLNYTMRYHFYSMTLDEFALVFEAWQQERAYDARTSWEQARFIAQCALMPYSKKGLKALRMSWCSIGRKRKSTRGQRPRRQRKMSHGYWRGSGTLKAFPPFVSPPPLLAFPFPICREAHRVPSAVCRSGGNARSRWNL